MYRECELEGCTDEYEALGMCHKHYTRFKRHGDPNFTKRNHEFHGMTGTPEYYTWQSLKDRCLNENNKQYVDYGARGITVCKEWQESFTFFLNDMGRKPFPRAQIDRIENNKGYYKSNCRWTTSTVNNRNSRQTKLSMDIARSIRKDYATLKCTQAYLARKYKISRSAIKQVVANITWKEV